MSTTFGVEIPSTKEIIPIARRVGTGNGEVKIFFINPLGELLQSYIPVIAIDNSNQGIDTVGDIKFKISGL